MIDNLQSNAETKTNGLLIDQHFDTGFADRIARLESYNKHLYRPNTYLHKWWARRCGSTFRLILKHLVQDPAQQDFYTPGGLGGKIILDPMVGGGTTLHEAIRLGANVIGADIDPIPLLQARATLSKLPLAQLETAFNQFFNYLYDELTSFYQTICPYCELPVEMQFMLYGLRRNCQCHEAIFVDSVTLRHNNDGSVFRLDSETHAIYRDDQLVSRAVENHPLPILERHIKTCGKCGQKYKEDTNLPFYKRYVPVAVSGKCGKHGLFFAPLSRHDLDIIKAVDERRVFLTFEPVILPIVSGPKSRSLIEWRVKSFLDLFTSRQLLFLSKSIAYMAPLDPLIRLNLALLISTSLEFNSMLCGYKGAKNYRAGTIRHTFTYHAYSFQYTALENNPIHSSRASGTLQNLYHSRIARGRKWALNPVERRIEGDVVEKVVIKGEIDAGEEFNRFEELKYGRQRFKLIQGSSISLELPDDSVDFVVTDPPYFDSVQYSDLATFFRVWLKQMLPHDAQWDYALNESAVDQQTNGDGQYTSVLTGIFKESHRVLKKNGRFIFTYHHWNPKGWSSITQALKEAGFKLVNRYVVHAENRVSVHIANQQALLHDVILVLAPIEAGIEREWEPLRKITTNESRQFCLECGTMVGWMLNHSLNGSEIDDLWLSILS